MGNLAVGVDSGFLCHSYDQYKQGHVESTNLRCGLTNSDIAYESCDKITFKKFGNPDADLDRQQV